MRVLSLIVSLLSLLCFTSNLSAQESAPAPAAALPASDSVPAQPAYVATEAEAIALGPKNKEFVELFNRYKEIAKKMTAMKIEYQTAKPSRQQEIDAEYPKAYQEGIDLKKKLVEVGLDAFDEAPNRCLPINDFLYRLVQWEFGRDNFEESVRIFKRLAKKPIDPNFEMYYVYGGLAALLTMDVEDADAWLKVASDKKYLKMVLEAYAREKSGAEMADSLQRMMDHYPEFKKDWEKEQAIRKAETEAGEKDPNKKLPRVLLKTSKGDIVVELFENEAPNAVANFISLVEKGFYNGIVFHRVLPLFMAQGGDPTGTGSGGPGYSIDCECKRPDFRRHFRGTLSMAHAGPNTGGSQFFLTFVPTFFLDGRHTAFGRVVEGMDVLADIQRFDPSDQDAIIPEKLDKIIEAKVLNKRNHEYEPIKNANRR